ncbi:MAG: hypothetical protein HYY01_04195 [Chloroflexi bacterium]|nr:hypothetical protein [Chloroflexota bacterium]
MEGTGPIIAEELEKAMLDFENKHPVLDAAMKLVGMTIADYERALRSTFTDTTITTNTTRWLGNHGDLG